MIEECLPLHVAERGNTWMAGIEYLFSQDNGEKQITDSREWVQLLGQNVHLRYSLLRVGWRKHELGKKGGGMR